MKEFAGFYIGGFVGCFVSQMIAHFAFGSPVSIVRLIVIPLFVAAICKLTYGFLKARCFGGINR